MQVVGWGILPPRFKLCHSWHNYGSKNADTTSLSQCKVQGLAAEHSTSQVIGHGTEEI